MYGTIIKILLINTDKHTNLQESLLVKEPPHVRDNPCPCDKITPDVVVHYQVQIPLPKPCFLAPSSHISYILTNLLYVMKN